MSSSRRKAYIDRSLQGSISYKAPTASYKRENTERDTDPKTRKRNVALRGVFDGLDVDRSGSLKFERISSYGVLFDSLCGEMDDNGETECDISAWLAHFNKVLFHDCWIVIWPP